MKTCIVPITLAALLPAMLDNGSIAAPPPAGGRPKEIASFKAHLHVVTGLAFSPDGESLVTGGSDGAVKLWDVPSGENRFHIEGPHQRRQATKGRKDGVRGVAFSPDGRTFASCGDDWNVHLWDATTGTNVETLRAAMGPPLLFSPDGKTLICGHWQIDLQTKAVREILKDGGGFSPTKAFDPQGRLLYVAAPSYMDQSIFSLWDVQTGRKTITCKTYSKSAGTLAFSRDGRTVACIGDDKAVRLWDTASGENKATYKLPAQLYKLRGPHFSPDDKILAILDWGADWREPCDILLLDLSSGKIVATLRGQKMGVNCLAFSRDGQMLASGSDDGVVKIWILPTRYAADAAGEKKEAGK